MSCQGRTSMEGRRDRMRGGVLVRVLMGLTLAETTWLLYPVLRARILTLEEGPAARGVRLAATLGCFVCHGPLGSGGMPNPRSLKGYIPGFWGADFDELVRDDDELQRWIEKGEIPRISGHPIGGWFFSRQAVKMPAFERFLQPADTEALMAYVRWIRAGAWRPLSGSPGEGL